MASRWRTWDLHFATDILGNKLPFDSLDSIPVGSRGKFRFNIQPTMLKIPLLQDFGKLDGKVGGRGKRLCEQNESKDDKLNKVNKTSLVDNAVYRKEMRQQWHEKEFPSLSETHTQSNDDKSTQEKVKNTKNVNQQFEDAEINKTIQDFSNQIFINEDIFPDPSVKAENTSDQNTTKEQNVPDEWEENLPAQSDTDIKDTQDAEKSLNDSEKESSFTSALKGEEDKSFTDNDFLQSLDEPEYYILIEGLTKEVDEENFKELISSFGEIELFLAQVCSDETHLNVIVKMVDSSHCDWVISCLDGDIYEDGGERLSAKAVVDMV